jgi:gliding motility-associated-like protein
MIDPHLFLRPDANCKKMIQLWLTVILLLCVDTLQAQSPDALYINDIYTIDSGSKTQWYGDVILGPNARLYIADGEKIYFYGKNFKMEPGAKIFGSNNIWTILTQGEGTGCIVFKQPNPNTGITEQQTIDGGNSGNPANNQQNTFTSIAIDNPKGVALINKDTRVGSCISFIEGHIYLNTNDLVLSDNAFINGYNDAKYIVTPATGHLVKENYAKAFEFPIGFQDDDYTPTTITPAGNNTIHANVSNYATSAADETGLNGIDRTWNIYGNASSQTAISLQHNATSNMSGFSPMSDYITRYGATPNNTGDMTSHTNWQVNTSGSDAPGSIQGSGIRSRVYPYLALWNGAAEAFYTKASTSVSSSIALIKTSTITDTNGNGIKGDVGDHIEYTFTITNTGTDALSDIAIADPTANVHGGPITSLRPGDADNHTITADYTISNSDVAVGQVENQATVTAVDPEGHTISDLSDSTSNTGNNPTVTKIMRVSPITVVKRSSQPVPDSEGSFAWIYTITLTNNMPVASHDTLTNIQVDDNLANVFVHGETYTVQSISASGGLQANAMYNGITTIGTLMPPNSKLAPQASDSVTIQVNVRPAGFSGNVYNQATTAGKGTHTGATGQISSDDPSNKEANAKFPKPTITRIPEVEIFIPSGFSPNGDRINDVFEIVHAQNLTIRLQVFNRWGNIVYQSNNYQNDWDGSGKDNFLGKKLFDGTYFYIVETQNKENGEIKKYTGYLTLKK